LFTFGKTTHPVFLAIVKLFESKSASWKGLDDWELIRQYQQTKDGKWVAYLMERHRGLIISRCMEFLDDLEEVKDFASGDIYLILQRELQEEEVIIRSFPSWLWTLITRKMIDERRKKKVRNDHRDAVIRQDPSPATAAVDEAVNYDQDRNWLVKGMDDALTAPERMVVAGLYLDEKSYKELMDELDLTFNQIRNIRHQALKKLKSHLGPEFSEYFNQ
jgi:RNA polymerase sigma factor (sigma-70 family)